MVNVTEKARDALLEALESSDAQEGQGLRLARSPDGQYGLTIDSEREGDQVVKQEERPLLLVDQDVASSLSGVTLDVVESDEGVRLALRSSEPD